MSAIIRPGTPKDMTMVLQLITELADFEKLANEVEVTVEDLVRDGFSETSKFNTFVAEEADGTIVGMTLFYERYSTWKGKTIHLEDLIVTKNKRGTGAGKALYTAVLNYAHANGYKRVAWEVLDWNTNAIRFYESTGAKILDGWQVVQMNEANLEKFIAQKS